MNFTLSSSCFWSSIIPSASIRELLILSAICTNTRETLEREGMPVMVRVYLHTIGMTRPLHDKLRWLCVRFPSVHKTNISTLTDIANKIIQIPTVVKVELDLHSIEVNALPKFQPVLFRLCKALEHKSLLLRCRYGCYHQGSLEFSYSHYGLNESGLLDLLRKCMCCCSIDIVLQYQNQNLYPIDVFPHQVLGGIS